MRSSTWMTLVAVTVSASLAGCGDSDSSSGGGVAGDSAGLYAGSTELEFTAQGFAPESSTLPTTIEILSDGTVAIRSTFDDGEVGEVSGRLEGNRIVATVEDAAFLGDAIVCSGRETWEGVVGVDRIDGTVSADGSCHVSGTTIPYTITGTFAVARGDAARMPVTGGGSRATGPGMAVRYLARQPR